MHDIQQKLEAMRAEARLGGGTKRIAAQHAKGKLTARERLLALVEKHELTNFEVTPVTLV